MLRNLMEYMNGKEEGTRQRIKKQKMVRWKILQKKATTKLKAKSYKVLYHLLIINQKR